MGHVRADVRKRLAEATQPPTDADRLAAIIALCDQANDYGIVSARVVRELAGGVA